MTRSSRESVSDRLRELPIQAARLTVTGVGKALMLTDRVRKDFREARESGVGPVLERLRHDTEQLVVGVVGKVAEHLPGQNGHATETPKRSTGPAAGRPPGQAGPAGPAAGRPKGPAAGGNASAAATRSNGSAHSGKADGPEIVIGKPGGATKATGAEKAGKAEELPVPDYDQASLASVRARLRALNAGQVGRLRDYERAHQARADFLRMFENRIAKLESDGA